MFFQGRGRDTAVHLAEVSDGVLVGPYNTLICPDAFSINLATDSFEHMNKCGPVDVPDYRGIKSSSGKVTFAFANVEDANYALAVLGTVTAAGGSGSVVAEQLPTSLPAGSVWFLGGLTRHRAITSLTITGMSLTTDYTLDAASGAVTFVGDQSSSPGPTASYSHTDPASVSMLSAAQKEFAIMFEFINKANANDPGSIELYRVRFDPAQNMDYLSDELQIPSLEGTVLADLTKDADDTEFGQFGRRVL
jgi:hypothetical protein